MKAFTVFTILLLTTLASASPFDWKGGEKTLKDPRFRLAFEAQERKWEKAKSHCQKYSDEKSSFFTHADVLYHRCILTNHVKVMDKMIEVKKVILLNLQQKIQTGNCDVPKTNKEFANLMKSVEENNATLEQARKDLKVAKERRWRKPKEDGPTAMKYERNLRGALHQLVIATFGREALK